MYVIMVYMNERQSAAKLLSNYLYGECSTTIPRKGSRLVEILAEKPDIVFKKLWDKKDSRFDVAGIYLILCTGNDEFYIGSSKNIHIRFRKHRNELNIDKHYGKYLQRSFTKYGRDSLVGFILEETIDFEGRELYWIKYLKPKFNSSEDVKRNFLNAQYYEAIQKAREKQQIKVVALTLEGNFVKEFDSVTRAAEFFGTSSTNISGVCKGRLRYMKDHLFIYKIDYDPNKSYRLKEYLAGTKNPKHLQIILEAIGKSVVSINIKTQEVKQYISISEAARSHNLTRTMFKYNYLDNKRLLGDLKFE